MSVLAGFASSASELVFGPPAPIAKDVAPSSPAPPTIPPSSSHLPSSKSARPASPPGARRSSMTFFRRASKDVCADQKCQINGPTMTQVPTDSTKHETAKPKTSDLPPLPSSPSTASVSVAETLLSSGASVLSALGSLVSSGAPGGGPSPETHHADDDDGATPTPSTITVRGGSDPALAAGGLLQSMSDYLLNQAVSVRDSAVNSVTEAATSLTSNAIHAVTDTATSISDAALTAVTGRHHPNPDAAATPRPPSPTASVASVASFSSRVDYIPPQYSADGTLFSSNPSIAAMQRIPDYPCGHKHLNQPGALHCCVASPPTRSDSAASFTSSSSSSSSTSASELVRHPSCNCDCWSLSSPVSASSVPASPISTLPAPAHTTLTAKIAGPVDTASKTDRSACQCPCHLTSWRSGQSGHFHRVEQLVRGTKRVVRDIKNVL
ncbi:hypothetical protein BCV70DRAFT_27176 [Testicularia cyperi]|uniref:Uncharacterized protein n=1 Tax=Testicularia cyperi TaxID=1882483 RepID=A0A317XKE6_9BASI|nr:hypothetical protein BCV70DRAFT_27176 [Testicularia cyperi]